MGFLKLLEWLLQNWKVIGTIALLIFLLSLIPNLTGAVRKAKEGGKELLTPLGFIIGVLLLLLVIFLLTQFKSIFNFSD